MIENQKQKQPYPFQLGGNTIAGPATLVHPDYGLMTWDPNAPTPGVIVHSGNFLNGTETRQPASDGGAWVSYNENGTQRVLLAPTAGPRQQRYVPLPHDIAIMADTLMEGRQPIFLDRTPHDPKHIVCRSYGRCAWRPHDLEYLNTKGR